MSARGSGPPPAAAGEEGLVTCMADVTAKDVAWLWRGRLPAGMLAVLDGDPGRGKSAVTIDLAARLTTGRPLPGDARGRQPMDVMLLSHEDSPGHTVRPRLDAAGADASRVHLLRHIGGRWPRLPDDVDHIEKVVRATSSRLLVIDPVSAYLGKTNTNSDNEVRSALGPLATMAERTGAVVLMLRHLSKEGGKSARHRGLGSVAIMALPRAALMLLQDPDDDTALILAWPKMSVARQPKSLRLRLRGAEDGALAEAPRLDWGGECDLSADDILLRQDRALADGSPGRLEDAQAWLREVLGDGPRRALEVERLAKAEGISLTGALKRARAAIADAQKRSDGWWWGLKPQEEQPPRHAPDALLAPLAPLEDEQEEQEERPRGSALLGDRALPDSDEGIRRVANGHLRRKGKTTWGV